MDLGSGGAMSAFHPFEYEARAPVTLVALDRARITVGAGSVSGLLTLLRFSDVKRNVGDDHAFFEINCSFGSKTGDRFRYFAVLPHTTALPPQYASCRLSPSGPMPSASLRLRPTVDPRGIIRPALDRGGDFCPLHDHDRLMLQVRESSNGIDVRLTTFNSRIERRPYGASGLSVEYEIPIQHFLWRKAPKYLSNEVIPEGADYVHFERTGRMDRLGIPMKISPIHVESPGDIARNSDSDAPSA